MLLSFSAKESNQRNLAQRLMNTIKQLLVNKLSAAPCSMKGSALAVSVLAEQDKADLGRASLGSLDVQNQNSSHPLILKIMVQTVSSQASAESGQNVVACGREGHSEFC
jgi:hypothetical protein